MMFYTEIKKDKTGEENISKKDKKKRNNEKKRVNKLRITIRKKKKE